MTNDQYPIINKLLQNKSVESIKLLSIREEDDILFPVCNSGEADKNNHKEIYSIRRMKKCIIQIETKYSKVCAKLKIYPDTRLFPQGDMRCGQIIICDSNEIVDAFNSEATCVMTRDGVFYICANTSDEAFKQFEIANLIASICCNAHKLGSQLSVLDPRHIALYKLNVTLPLMEELDKELVDGEEQARETLSDAISELYKNNLFLDSNGAASIRLSDDAFIITASDKERSSIMPDDLVLINNGRREPGKHPSNSAALHKMIYDKNPHINSIVISHPHYSMAYSACSCDIPLDKEATEKCGGIRRYPFGATVMQPKLFSDVINKDIRAYLIENDCLVCFGNDVNQAVEVTNEVERCASKLKKQL